MNVDCIIVLQGLQSIQKNGAFLSGFDGVVLASQNASEAIATLTSRIMLPSIQGPFLVLDPNVPNSRHESPETIFFREFSERNSVILSILQGR